MVDGPNMGKIGLYYEPEKKGGFTFNSGGKKTRAGDIKKGRGKPSEIYFRNSHMGKKASVS